MTNDSQTTRKRVQRTKINIEQIDGGWSVTIRWPYGEGGTLTASKKLKDILRWTSNTVREDGSNAR